MIGTIARKARQVRDDPVLRQWLLARMTGQTSGAITVRQADPDYLHGLPPLVVGDAGWPSKLLLAPSTQPSGTLELSLPGAQIELEARDPTTLFAQTFSDTETLLAVHRFAWLPLMMPYVDHGWVAALWGAWLDKFAVPSDGWPWHPYTAAERAINIIDYCLRFGCPGDPGKTITVLARHALSIRERLEYFGETYTSNHLANNGRALYRLGLFLDWPACITVGETILLREAPMSLLIPSFVAWAGLL